jgi:hypothetical protein
MSEESPTPAPAASPAKKTQKPSIGRVVHFVLPADSVNAGEHRAATIAKVVGGDPGPNNVPAQAVNLSVTKGDSLDFVATEHGQKALSAAVDSSAVVLIGSVPHDSTGTPGTWHWPEQV